VTEGDVFAPKPPSPGDVTADSPRP